MKKKRRWVSIVLIGLGVSLFTAVFVSPFASPSPDGLEKVAEEQGFSEKENSGGLRPSLLPDYYFPGIRNRAAAKALAGLTGTLAVCGVALGLGGILAKSSRRKDN